MIFIYKVLKIKMLNLTNLKAKTKTSKANKKECCIINKKRLN